MKTTMYLLACFLLLAMTSPAEEPPQPEAPAEPAAKESREPAYLSKLLGVWKGTEDGELVRFEKKRVTALGKGRRTFLMVHYTAEEALLCTSGRILRAKITFEGEDLILAIGPKSEKYIRQDEVPDSLLVKPFDIGEAGPLEEEKVKAVQTELSRRAVEDQAVRKQKERMIEMQKVDRGNTLYLKTLIKEVGWIDAERFGPKVANHAFIIVQHSGDLPLMLAALPFIEADVKAKRLDAQPYAMLYDRLELNLGRPQRFGTQIGQAATGAMIVLPLEDKENVEKIRKEIGLFPLKRYLGFFKQGNKGKDVEFMDFPPEEKKSESFDTPSLRSGTQDEVGGRKSEEPEKELKDGDRKP